MIKERRIRNTIRNKIKELRREKRTFFDGAKWKIDLSSKKGEFEIWDVIDKFSRKRYIAIYDGISVNVYEEERKEKVLDRFCVNVIQ